MRISRWCSVGAVLLILHAGSRADELLAPRIAGVEPLTEGTALVWWDSVSVEVTRIGVMVKEHLWSAFESRGECDARRGWIIVSGLEAPRHYTFVLTASAGRDTASRGPLFDYSHTKPIADWVFFPGGQFEMGDSLDPQAGRHRVCLSSFMLSASEVTNREYLEYCMSDSVPLPEDPAFPHLKQYVNHYPDYPVVNVSWQSAVDYCNWMSRRMGLPTVHHANGIVRSDDGAGLPTEAEWEFAARFAHGDDSADSKRPQTSRSYPASPEGLSDLAGNVWEWCRDWYAPYDDAQGIVSNPVGPLSGSYKVVRGGSWADSSRALRAASRGRLSPSVTMSTVGFRVARSFPIPSPKVIDVTRVEEHHALAK